MKREVYTLADEQLMMFVNKVGTVLNEEGIEHSIVGGVSVQAYILSMLTSLYSKNICELIHDPKIRIQDYLRHTDDLDLSVKSSLDRKEMNKKVTKLLPKFEFEDISPSFNHIISSELQRIGEHKPIFKFYVDSHPDDSFSMNLNQKEQGILKNLNDSLYDRFIESSKQLTLPYNNENSLSLRVYSLEHLLATKIAGARPKDLMDTTNLSNLIKRTNYPLDFVELGKLLGGKNREKYLGFKKNYDQGDCPFN